MMYGWVRVCILIHAPLLSDHGVCLPLGRLLVVYSDLLSFARDTILWVIQ